MGHTLLGEFSHVRQQIPTFAGGSEEFADKILQNLRSYAQYYPDYINTKADLVKSAAQDVASQIVDKVIVVKAQATSQIKNPFTAENFQFRYTGGGLLIPYVKETLESRLGHKLLMADDIIYSNAIGLQCYHNVGSCNLYCSPQLDIVV